MHLHTDCGSEESPSPPPGLYVDMWDTCWCWYVLGMMYDTGLGWVPGLGLPATN